MEKNYVAYHVHTELSLLDSVTKFQDYIDIAVRYGQKAIAFTEHGNIYQWTDKKMACDKAGLKYIHGVECYLTRDLEQVNPKTGEAGKVRDNFHTVLLAKNYDGVLELNELVSKSSLDDHFYYDPRITFREFLGTSSNIIRISACLASPLNRLQENDPMYEKLLRHYNYLEIQPHLLEEQVAYNRHLADLSARYGIPLIAGTDTHSLDSYKAECRTMLQYSKGITFSDEDSVDLTYKSREELEEMFRAQDALPEQIWAEAIDNTTLMADSVDPFELDVSFKYPPLYGDRDKEVLLDTVEKGLLEKEKSGAIPQEQVPAFRAAIQEEMRVFEKIDMSGFMLFMSELTTWCREHDIPLGFNRGSCGGSRVAYLSNITDLNPETWGTVFSRFCNEDRKELGDIDLDASPSDRDKIYDYIINRFGERNTAFILAIGTIKSKGCIDEICRGLSTKWKLEHLKDEKKVRRAQSAVQEGKISYDCSLPAGEFTVSRDGALFLPEADRNTPSKDLSKRFNELSLLYRKENERIIKKNPWDLAVASKIKKQMEVSEETARKVYPEVFRYYDGLHGAAISQSLHPAGIVASPISLPDHYGVLHSGGKTILQIDMGCVHEVGLVKYDILALKNVEIVKDACKLIGKPYPKSHEINWNDQAVWKDMLRSPAGIFEFEGDYAFTMLCRYEPHSIYDMSLVTAAIRPSGASYRDDLMAHKPHKNPSPIIDELLKENNGYLVYQEDVIKFLQEICGLSGSEADNTRRAIGRKDEERLQKALPRILDGYCEKSSLPRAEAEKEAQEFIQVIKDSSNYMFGKNHSIGYCMLGYLCAYLRYYHPCEFITAFLNNANGEADLKSGSELASLYGVSIVPPRFGLSRSRYEMHPETKVIAKGIASVKYMNQEVAEQLYTLSQNAPPESFMELLLRINSETNLDARQREILIRLDYFQDYGNAKELLRMVEIFSYFKNGAAKKILKSSLDQSLSPIIGEYASGVGKDGKEAKSWTITDMPGLLRRCESMVRDLHLQDFTMKEKMLDQKDLLGYVDLTTGKPEDRRRLLVMDVIPLRGKTSGIPWAYAIQTRSIGTGKSSRLTVRAQLCRRRPIQKSDIIYAQSLHKEKSGYWYLDEFRFEL